MNRSEEIQLMIEQLRSSANVILSTGDSERIRYRLYLSLLAISFALEVFDARLTTLESEKK